MQIIKRGYIGKVNTVDTSRYMVGLFWSSTRDIVKLMLSKHYEIILSNSNFDKVKLSVEYVLNRGIYRL